MKETVIPRADGDFGNAELLVHDYFKPLIELEGLVGLGNRDYLR